MEQGAESEPLEQAEHSGQKRPLVFLDTDVIIGYVRGERAAVQLFSAEADGRIHFAVNGIVLQELILAGDVVDQPEFERILDHLRILPVELAKAEALIPRARAMRNLPHVNDIIIVSSAGECDFLVTTDTRLRELVTGGKPQVVNPEEFVGHLLAA
jgi:predicted nucleic acid-binding protein